MVLCPPRKLGLDRSCVQNTITLSGFIEELLSEMADAAKNISKFWHKSKEDEVELSNRPHECSDVVTEEPWKLSAPSCLENVQRDDVEIVFLGTGSSIPSKYRNVSSIFSLKVVYSLIVVKEPWHNSRGGNYIDVRNLFCHFLFRVPLLGLFQLWLI